MNNCNKYLMMSINASKQRSLKRIYLCCNNSINDNNNVIECIFGKPNASVEYFNTSLINSVDDVFVWQGVAKYGNELLIVGTSQPGANTGQGIIYFGNINCVNGKSYTLSVPGAEYSSVYGPRCNDFINNIFTFVGSYTLLNDTNIYAFLFRGQLTDLTNPSNYILQMQYISPEHIISFTHSTDGNFAVGNSGSNAAKDTESWLYNISNQTYTIISFPGAKTTTTYGIVKNQNDSYTIVGGFSQEEVPITNIYIKNGFVAPVQYAFAADFTYYNNTITFSNWTSIRYNNQYLTHFEGISTTNNPNVYSISSDVLGLRNYTTGFFLTIERMPNNTFVPNNWVPIDYGKTINKKGLTTSNSVIDNNIVGLFIEPNGVSSAFQASINLYKCN